MTTLERRLLHQLDTLFASCGFIGTTFAILDPVPVTRPLTHDRQRLLFSDAARNERDDDHA